MLGWLLLKNSPSFYTCLDPLDFHEERNTLVEMLIIKNDEKIVFTEKEVNIALSKVNPRKPLGPDQLCGKVIKECWLQRPPCDSETLPIING